MGYCYSPNERVGSLRYAMGRGTVLDYTGVIVQVAANGTSALVRFRDGEVESHSTHPDCMMSMASAYAYAGAYLDDPTRPVSGEALRVAFVTFAAGCDRRPDFWELKRSLWVLAHDRDGARAASVTAKGVTR